MNQKLPIGFQVLSPTRADAERITELVCRVDVDEFGHPDTDVQDLLALWRRSGFDLQNDAWMVIAPDGKLAGYADMHYAAGLARLNNMSSVHPAYKECGIQDWFLERAEEWARGHVNGPTITLRHVVNADQPAKMERMMRWGYHAVRHAWIMRIALDKPIPVLVAPEGITLRTFERGRDERAVWAAIQESFRDLWEHQDVPYDQWASFVLEHSGFAPELSFLAVDGAEITGATIVMRSAGEGWVQQVAVRRPWRARGIGLALLRAVFSALYQEGIPSAGLEVDAENPSGALRLYERAGMHVKQKFTEFRKEL
jgi:GNAT superfamily N-acetyltransferase